MFSKIFLVLFIGTNFNLAYAEQKDDPRILLFSKILKLSTTQNKAKELSKLDGMGKINHDGADGCALKKDPKYHGVTYWGHFEKGTVGQFHLAIHRKGYAKKVKSLIEKTYSISLGKAQWRDNDNGLRGKKIQFKKITKNGRVISFWVSRMPYEGETRESTVLHVDVAK